jgi:predicted anti-sigma-YlaC factor YlaD
VNDCSPTRTLLRAWLADQLEEEEKAAITAHLEACGSCAALRRTYKATVAMGAWPEAEIPLPEQLGEVVREAVRQSKLQPEPDPDAETPENDDLKPPTV